MKKKIALYILELIIVFVGVFSAFLLNNRRQKAAQEDRKKDIYMALYQDLNRFYLAGNKNNPEGFINLFTELSNILDSAIKTKSIPPVLTVYADYYNIEITSSMLTSGVLGDVDIQTFKDISRFHSQHSNMLSYIDQFNEYYLDQVTSKFEESDSFYLSEPTRLKPSLQPLMSYLDIIISHAERLVSEAEKRKEYIKDTYLAEEF